MNSLNQILPFYDSLRKVSDPVDSGVKILCPIHKLPAFQFRRDHSTTEWPMLINLVDTLGNKTNIISYFDLTGELITSWTNVSFATFTSSGKNITSAIDNSVGAIQYAYSNDLVITSGEVYKAEINLTLNSGDAPRIAIGFAILNIYSNIVTLENGYNVAYLTATATGTYKLLMVGPTGLSNFSCTVSLKKVSFPRIMSYTTYDYIQYNGEALNTMLPKGAYYLEIVSGVNPATGYPAIKSSIREYNYSEWLQISEINKNLINTWSEQGFDTFTSSGSAISSAISSGSARAVAVPTRVKNVKKDDIFRFTCFLTFNSGTEPYLRFRDPETDDNLFTPVQLSDGMNDLELTLTKTPYNSEGLLDIYTGAATNFSTNECGLFRDYSEDYITLEYSNSSDLGTILYQDGFVQQGWFGGFLGKGEGQTERIGDELDGQFIDEKVISRFVYKMKLHVNKFIYRGLQLLRGHSSITITDKDGNQYTPLNIEVDPPNWNGERGLCEIRFTTSEDIFINARTEDNIT